MNQGARVIVAGAGALGLSAALALVDAGYAVTVCEADQGPSASAVAAGMLAPVFEAVLDAGSAPTFDLLLAARDLWPALEARTGATLDRSGAMAVGKGAWLAQIHARLLGLGIPLLDLQGVTARNLVPGLSPKVDRGLLVREDWRLEARPALAALRAAAKAAGVTFRNTKVTRRGDSDWLVLATGSDQSLVDLAPELRVLSPIKGQILRFPGQGPGRVSLRAEGAYVAPDGDGLAVGATMEPGLADTTIDAAALSPLVQVAGELFPALVDAPFSASAGVRATTPDGLPLVGFSASQGVVLAVGARRNGWLLAPMTAAIVAACLTGRDPGPYAARLDPRRFDAGAAA